MPHEKNTRPLYHSLSRTASVGWLLLLALTSTVGGAQLVINHDTHIAKFNEKVVKDGKDFLIKKPYSAKVTIAGTNSALFDCALKQENTSTPEVEASTTFLKALGPYVLELGGVLLLQFNAKEHADTLMGAVEAQATSHLKAIRQALTDSTSGISIAETRLLLELQTMRSESATEYFAKKSFYGMAAKFCELDDKRNCQKLKQVRPLVENIESLSRLLNRLTIEAQNNPQRLKELADDASMVVENADKIIGHAYDVERLFKRVDRAAPTIACPDTVTLSLSTSKNLTISVNASSSPSLSRAATLAPFSITLKARPDWLVRPAVGLSYMHVNDATFDKFGTKKVSDTQFTITSTGTSDNRNAFGLTLATTYRGLDQRSSSIPFAIWLPDITISPDKDVKSFALGGGVSISVFKIGYGVAWTKHTVLAKDQAINGTLASADELATRDSYGKPLKYFSISVIGVPPFVP
jgi:hypothetical protein